VQTGLQLTPEIASAIRAHGRETYPHECCGALVGRDGDVTSTVPLPNITDEGPRRRFRVSDLDYLRVERAADAAGAQLLGFYHSHPDHPAIPSAFDLEHAWPNLSYLIVSVRSGRAAEARSWRLRADRSGYDEEHLWQ